MVFYDDKGITIDVITEHTDQNGNFRMELLRDVDVNFSIAKMGLRKKIRIPDQSLVSFDELM